MRPRREADVRGEQGIDAVLHVGDCAARNSFRVTADEVDAPPHEAHQTLSRLEFTRRIGPRRTRQQPRPTAFSSRNRSTEASGMARRDSDATTSRQVTLAGAVVALSLSLSLSLSLYRSDAGSRARDGAVRA